MAGDEQDVRIARDGADLLVEMFGKRRRVVGPLVLSPSKDARAS